MKSDTVLDFGSFLRQFAPKFKIDDASRGLVKLLGYYGLRDPRFEQCGDNLYLEKGLLLMGPVGTGKTAIMHMFKRYLAYINSTYTYDLKIVWEFAEKYKKNSFSAFSSERAGNRYYDELCLTDKRNPGEPVREYVAHYGEKILVGEELIRVRYEIFKETGYQTHFSTNATEKQLELVYGERCFSRLFELCNFVPYTGADRRMTARPVFTHDLNKPQAPVAKELTVDEVKENKMRLNSDYQKFCESGMISSTAEVDYTILVQYGCDLGNEEDMRGLMESVTAARKQEISHLMSLEGPKDHRTKVLFAQYRDDKVDEKEKLHLWAETRRLAVKLFFQSLKMEEAPFIFGKRPEPQEEAATPPEA